MQEFLQTDENNIKMNNRLIKESKKLEKLDISIKNNNNNINNNNNNVLKSEESNNIVENNKNDYEPKETTITTMPNIDRILLTEMETIDIKNIKNTLLNNNNIKDKIMHNNSINKRNSDECIRINTLYNKDDSFDTIKPNHFKNEIINSIQKDDKTNNDNIPNVKINEIKNNNNYKKLELTEKNEFISKAINGLNENNYINNNSKKRIKSMEKIQDNSIRNSYNNNKKNIANKDKNNNKLLLNICSVPLSNHIYKKLTTYSDKEKIIQKFINQKNTIVTKKEEPKRENTDLENGKHLYQNTKYKYKNRYSQEAIIGHNKHIHNGIIRANGANEMSFANKNMSIVPSNINDFIYTKKKNRKTKSIDDNYKRNNSKLFKELNMKENTNTGFLNRKNSKTNMNSNDYYMKMNNKKNLYNKIIKDKKFIDYPYMDSFRYKRANKRQNFGNLNKKLEISDLSDTNR